MEPVWGEGEVVVEEGQAEKVARWPKTEHRSDETPREAPGRQNSGALSIALFPPRNRVDVLNAHKVVSGRSGRGFWG